MNIPQIKTDTKYNHRIMELFELEETFKIIESYHEPSAAQSSPKPCP